ncbi:MULTISPECIES: 2-C-methyl-D-erythritol 4-phosphate cytidylyltransferase [unclassified Lentimicrobium]|uniref:2-C-methyl-D-erythritol 4-phosphate cytidylyltransferase n=1 Tax=unclassified Lentimicrobium TaxID=2677434 RepID=UPI0015541E31|nr:MULTISPECIES: 2-C-methyl-D-erythritol 4-phosphate cytidylyltransferase [unclassified Lentimicrobium]NPD45701.1 2-C-methyl-D-erythritol 4-phosphate cytidylyltransferase [Lentimicrobium sp. S6]NPD85580.1 2-C-methyl-D-erythritol 4-phosphate cytidylyltransferase [Lentimicrobium sp. L6]
MKNYALILAGGSGNRMQEETPKAFLEINQKYLIEYSILKFSEHPQIDKIILVVPKDYLKITEELVKNKKYQKVSAVKQGGTSRFESSRIAVNTVEEDQSKVLIHDAARPFITHKIISQCLESLEQFDALNLLSPISDTLIQLQDNQIIGNVDRALYRQAQTPQSFQLNTIKKTHEAALSDDIETITDDFNLVLKYQTGTCSWVEGNRMNFKITYPEDLELARLLLH